MAEHEASIGATPARHCGVGGSVFVSTSIVEGVHTPQGADLSCARPPISITGDRTPCFLPPISARSSPTSPPSTSNRTPPRSTFDVGAQPGQDLRPALMAFARGLAHEAGMRQADGCNTVR